MERGEGGNPKKEGGSISRSLLIEPPTDFIRVDAESIAQIAGTHQIKVDGASVPRFLKPQFENPIDPRLARMQVRFRCKIQLAPCQNIADSALKRPQRMFHHRVQIRGHNLPRPGSHDWLQCGEILALQRAADAGKNR